MSDTDPQVNMEKSTEEEEEKWAKCPSPESPRKPVKSTAVVKYTKIQVPANFARLQCNTNLNLPPSNWLSSSAESYGLQNVPLHSSGFSSFCMAHMFPDCVGEVDVVSDAENIKNLLKIPYSKGPVSMMVHRVENTLLIDEFDIHKHLLRTSESEWQWLKKFFYEHVLQTLGEKEKIVAHKDKSRCALQQKSLVSKFLYHSLVTTEHADNQRQQELETSESLPVAEVWPPLPEPQIEEELPDPLSNHKFARNVVWTFEDIQMLIGTDLPIFGGATHPCITLRLRDASKPISVLTGIDYWLDNLMCNVPELVMCYHLEGIVQKYELIKTEDLPHLENSKFSPKVIRDVAQNILSFLKANATKAGHTYWLFKGKDAEVVKLYDLTSLCTEVTDEKGQNPFTIPVAMLLYRVARNMKHSSDGQRQQGTIRMLLKNCIMLLPKEKYPQIVTSAHYMLSDLYIPADTDPVAPGLSERIADEGECEPEEEEDEDEECGSKSSSVAVKSLCLASGEGNRKFSPPQQPLPGGVADRCKYSLQHITAGLACLPFFDFESHEEEKSTNFMEKNEDNMNMARPFEAIPMPYEPINKDVAVDSVTPTTSGKRRKDSLQTKSSTTKSMSKQKDNHSQEKDLSPKSLLCSMKAEAMPTWQMPAPGDNRFWKSHLKILLYEKARLVYATRAEMEFVAKNYGSTLRNISHVLCCQRMLEMRSLEASNSQSLESYLLGRAGDICFMVVQDWARVDQHRDDFARVSDIDREILKSDKLLKYDLEPIPREIASMAQMLLASYRCYQRALNLKSHNQEKNNLLRRLGNTDNELGVLYMNQASALFQEKGLCQEVEHLLTLSQRYLEEGVKAFESVHDSANLALLLSNTGRLMRTCAHLKAPAERTSFISSERNFYEKAMTSYQKAIQTLGTNKSNPTVWNTVMWEMSTTLFTMASLLQDNPADTKDETEREVADLLLKSLKYCDLDTPGPRQPAYQYRAAAIHHRLATLYNRSYRSLAVDDPKRRNVLQLSRIHYEKASNLLLLLENTCDFLGLQLERINFCEYQAAGMPNFAGKMKSYHFALEILLGCLPVIKLIEDRNRTVDAVVDRNSKSKKKKQENKKTGKVKSCDEANKENETESNTNKTVELKADEDEEGEEQKLLLLLEQRLQYILLCITKLYHTRSKKETESQQSEFYRRLYSHSLRKASGGDSNMPHHLRSILVQLSPENQSHTSR